MAVVKKLQNSVLHSQMERHYEIINLELFTCTNVTNIELTTFLNAVYLSGHENNSTKVNCELH